MRRIGEMGAETTGYGLLADENDFNIPNVPRRLGTSGGFLYVQRGIIGIVTELWDVYAAAGIEKDWFFPIRPLNEEENLKLLKWSDEQLEGEGFMDWTPFEHPQLGPVELGGWKRLFMFRNPPAHHLPELCHKNMLFTLQHALISPRLNISDVKATRVADELFKIEAIVENLGYLPTYVTRRAIDAKVVTPVIAELALGDRVGAGRRQAAAGSGSPVGPVRARHEVLPLYRLAQGLEKGRVGGPGRGRRPGRGDGQGPEPARGPGCSHGGVGIESDGGLEHGHHSSATHRPRGPRHALRPASDSTSSLGSNARTFATTRARACSTIRACCWAMTAGCTWSRTGIPRSRVYQFLERAWRGPGAHRPGER